MAILPKESYDTVVCTMLPVKKRLTFLPSDLVMVICAVLVPFQVAKEMSLDALVSLMWPKESYFGLLICHSTMFEPSVRLKSVIPVRAMEMMSPESVSSVT